MGDPLKEQLPQVRKEIGLLFQDPDGQLFNPVVFDEIAFALRQLGLSLKEINEKVYEVAKALGITHLLNRLTMRLSYGKKKKVALASILVYNPKILLPDEPVSNLTPKFVEEFKTIIRKLKSEGKSIVIATHDINFVIDLADRIYILHQGYVIAEGKINDLLFDKELLERAELELLIIMRILEKMIEYSILSKDDIHEISLALEAFIEFLINKVCKRMKN